MGLNTDWRIEIHRGIDNEQASGLSNLIHSLSPPNRQRRSLAPEYYLWKLSQNPSGRGVVALAVNSKKKNSRINYRYLQNSVVKSTAMEGL